MLEQHKDAFLSIRVEGPDVRASRIRLEDFLHLGKNLMRAVERVALVLAGYGDRGRAGRRPEGIREALSLDLVGFTHGSDAAVALFERCQPQQLLEGMDLGREAYEKLLAGVTLIQEHGTVPPGYDRGVLRAVRDMGKLFDHGVSSVNMRLNGTGRDLCAHYTPGVRSRVEAQITKPHKEARSIEGRLMMADFGNSHPRIRIEPAVGRPVRCNFDEDLKESVHENILNFVRATGTAVMDPETNRIRKLKLDDVEPLEYPEGWTYRQGEDESPTAGPFWRVHEIGDLASEQEVQAVGKLEDLLGGWPDEEADDGFEEELRKWRAADTEAVNG